MGNLTEHVMINKWDDDINSAITKVGGDTSNSEGLPDYANIIKSQLVSNEAVGEGIYQDFLYVNEDNQPSELPWDGEPTTSTNAVQASTIANSIKQLYDTMALTERFNVLLVDEIPKTEINLSAVYLIRSKSENSEEGYKENTYTGCYFVKTGKTVKKIDLSEFEVNLDELFFLTRAEYDANLSIYIKEIEDLLKKKFGKYWNDEGFALDETLDQIVLDIIENLKNETDKLLEDINRKIEEALHGVGGILEEIDTKIEEIDEEVDNLEIKLNSRIDILEQDLNQYKQDVSDIYLNKNTDYISIEELNELK